MNGTAVIGWLMLALLFGVAFAAMVIGSARTEGWKTAFLGVSAIWAGSMLLVVFVHAAVYLIKS